MEVNQVLMMKDKLNFIGIFKQVWNLIPRNPKFVILIFLTSLPYFSFLFFSEITLQQSFTVTVKSKLADPNYYLASDFIIDLLVPYILPGLLHLVIVHLLQLLSAVAAVRFASMIYAEHDTGNLKEMLLRPFRNVGLKGPLITSIYVLMLTSITMIGLASFSSNLLLLHGLFNSIFFGVMVIALLIKYLEWGAIWNMGIVISILEEKHGDVAIGVSAYISRGSRGRGLLLMLVFFVWCLVLRLIWVYSVWTKSLNLVASSAVEALFICFGNVVKWVAFTVYFYDCKKRFLEKKVDVEQGRAAQRVIMTD